MKQKIVQVLVGIIIGSIALWFGFRDVDLHLLYDEISSIHLIYIVYAVAVMILSHWLRAYRWKLLFNGSTSDQSVGVYPFFSATMIGYAVNNAIPRGGEIAKAVYLAKSTGMSQSKVLGTVVLERLMDFIFLIVMFGVTSLAYSGEMNDFFPGLGIVAVAIFIIASVILLIFTLMPHKKLYRGIRYLFSGVNKRLAVKIAQISVLFSEGMSSLKHSKRVFSVGFVSLIIWLCYSVMTWIPLFAFEFQNQLNLSLMAGIAIMTISSIGVILPSPGGAGTFHFFCSAVLVNMFLVSKLDAMSFATTIHLMNFVVTTVLGLSTYLVDRLRK